MKKILTLIIIICLTITLTACNGKKSIKTLTCEYDMSAEVSDFDKTNLKITFEQDTKDNKLVSGSVIFTVKASGISSSGINEIKASFEEEFCGEGFFGEGTNKSCKVTADSSSVTATIEIDTDKLIETEQLEYDENTLTELKETLEEEFGSNQIICNIK